MSAAIIEPQSSLSHILCFQLESAPSPSSSFAAFSAFTSLAASASEVPPQYYPFLKKLGDDTPELKPFMDKLINGEMTFDDDDPIAMFIDPPE